MCNQQQTTQHQQFPKNPKSRRSRDTVTKFSKVELIRSSLCYLDNLDNRKSPPLTPGQEAVISSLREDEVHALVRVFKAMRDVKKHIDNIQKFISMFPHIIITPFLCEYIGEKSPIDAYQVRRIIVDTLDLQSHVTSEHILSFASFQMFRLRQNRARTYLNRDQMMDALTELRIPSQHDNAIITPADLLPDHIIGHPSVTRVYTNIFIRAQEDDVVSLLVNASPILSNEIQGRHQNNLSDEQSKRLDEIIASPLYCLSGGPGRGKSRLIFTLVQIALKAGLRTIVIAPSHKAVGVLRQGIEKESSSKESSSKESSSKESSKKESSKKESSKKESSTMDDLKICTIQKLSAMGTNHSINGNNNNIMWKNTFIIIDEASMCCLADLSGLHQYLSKCGCAYQLLFVGDAMQLPPIDRGEIFRHLLTSPDSQHGTNTMKHGVLLHCHRTDQIGILTFIDAIGAGKLDTSHVTQSSDVITTACDAYITTACDAYITTACDAYHTDSSMDVIISPSNETRKAINERMQMLHVRNLQKSKHNKANGARFGQYKVFHEGDPVIYTSSDAPSNEHDWLRNGIMGRVVRVIDESWGRGMVISWTERKAPQAFVVCAEMYARKNSTRSMGSMSLNEVPVIDIMSPYAADIELAYCITGHKSQGSEFDRVIVCLDERDTRILSSGFDRRWLYTAVSRGKKSISVICTDAAKLAAAIERPVLSTAPLRI